MTLPPAADAPTTARIAQSVLLFPVAGLCEIGGGYLVWLWLGNGRGIALGILGGLVLFLYGVLPTLQPPGIDFGGCIVTLRIGTRVVPAFVRGRRVMG